MAEKLGVFPIHAPPPVKSAIALSILLFLTPIAYWAWGCSTDWVVVGGFLFDIAGALLIAVPDLPAYEDYTYGGRVRRAYQRLVHDKKGGGRIAPNTRYYESFYTAIGEKLLPSQLPQGAYFDIEYSNRSDNLLRIKDSRLNGQERISIGNVERDLTSIYRREDGRYRRLGALLLVIGFTTQLAGMAVSKVFVPGLC